MTQFAARHYLPRFYLRGFANDSGAIWVHERRASRSFISEVNAIANASSSASELESDLASLVEELTSGAIMKIRARRPLDAQDRRAIARYIVMLWKRVPLGRSRHAEWVPEVAASLGDELDAELLSVANEPDPHAVHRVEQRRAKVRGVIEHCQHATTPGIWKSAPTDVDGSVASVLSMKWHFLCSDGVQFLACDDPVFSFKQAGIAKVSELTIPVSSSVTLWAHRRHVDSPEYGTASRAQVREINHRTAHNASRFVFSERDEGWIMPFLRKPRYALSRLR